MKTKKTKQQVPIDAYTGWFVMSGDFSDEFPCTGDQVINKISVSSYLRFYRCSSYVIVNFDLLFNVTLISYFITSYSHFALEILMPQPVPKPGGSTEH